MKIRLNKDGYIESFALIGKLDDAVEVDDPEQLDDFLKHFTAYKLSDGVLVLDADKLRADADAAEITDLRARRERECFRFVDRGQLWYAALSASQLAELGVWYAKWLDVTRTRVIPERPAWLKDF